VTNIIPANFAPLMSSISEEKAHDKDIDISNLITDGKNPRGIPKAKFIVSS